MKYNGIEIEEYNDKYLIKQLGLLGGTIKLCCGTLGIGCILGLFFFVGEVQKYGFSYTLAYMLPLIPYLAVACLIFGIPVFILNRYKKGIQEELHKRTIPYTDKAKKTSRRFIIMVVVGIAIFVVVLLSNLSGPKCRDCGKRGVYSKYGYCYSCYQEVYNGIEDNGK